MKTEIYNLMQKQAICFVTSLLFQTDIKSERTKSRSVPFYCVVVFIT